LPWHAEKFGHSARHPERGPVASWAQMPTYRPEDEVEAHKSRGLHDRW
jgi:hypothetical protein